MNQNLIEALNEGAKIHYAPVSGGIILLTGNEENSSDVNQEAQPTMMEFLELQQDEVIESYDSMSQGHHIFRGQVTFYRKKK